MTLAAAFRAASARSAPPVVSGGAWTLDATLRATSTRRQPPIRDLSDESSTAHGIRWPTWASIDRTRSAR
ncbi:hypothetical protein Thiosp_04944 [Thiorhodovibrio litoralis]|nr:hypothetical protein Thiosp_04944 [Thiorhodovibrio litoralis]